MIYTAYRLCFLIGLVLLVSACKQQTESRLDWQGERFKKDLKAISSALKIEELSFAVINHDEVILEETILQGSTSLQDGPHLFVLPSITDFMTTLLTLKLIKEGKINLNDSVEKFGIRSKKIELTVKKLLTHFDEKGGNPVFRYDKTNYIYLREIAEKATGSDYLLLVQEKIINDLGLSNTISIADFMDSKEGEDHEAFQRLRAQFSPSQNEKFKKTAFITSIQDVSKILIAIHKGFFNEEEVFKLQYLKNGRNIPYGLGWFVQQIDKKNIAWTFGSEGNSSLLVIDIVPQKRSLVVISNSSKLNDAYPLGKSNILESGIGLRFVKNFLYEKPLPDIAYAKGDEHIHLFFDSLSKTNQREIYLKELIGDINVARYSANREQDQKLTALYNRQFPFELPDPILNLLPIANIQNVKDRSDIQEGFTIREDTSVRVFGFGEFLVDYIDKPWKEDNVTIYFSQNNTIAQYRFNYDNRCISGNYEHYNLIDFQQTDPSAGSYRIEMKFPRLLTENAGRRDSTQFQIAVVDKLASGEYAVSSLGASKNDLSVSASAADLKNLVFLPEGVSNESSTSIVASKCASPPVIDGIEDALWKNSKSYPIHQPSGKIGSPVVTKGSFKIQWDGNFIYLIVTILDNSKVKAKALDFDADYGWIENSAKEKIWTMSARSTKYGGGAFKNRYIDTVLYLPKGEYTAHYVTDEGSSFGTWSGALPECSFYGLCIYPCTIK